MTAGGFMGLAYKLADWITKLAYVNILWILFTLGGLVVFGLFPATIAMFAVIRSFLKNGDRSPIFKTFFKYYKKEFIKSNLIGIVFMVVSSILYIDIIFLGQSEGSLLQIIYYPVIVMGFLFYVTTLYLFPLYVHFDAQLKQLFQNSFLIMIVNPLATFSMVLAVVTIYFGCIYFPAIIPFFSGSLPSLVILSCVFHALKKVEDKKDSLSSSEAK